MLIPQQHKLTVTVREKKVGLIGKFMNRLFFICLRTTSWPLILFISLVSNHLQNVVIWDYPKLQDVSIGELKDVPGIWLVPIICKILR